MLWLSALANATPITECPRPITSAEIVDASDRAEAQFAEQDPEGFDAAQKEVVERLGCVKDPLSPSDVVRVQRVVALGAFMHDDEPGMRAAIAGMVQVDIRARFPEAVVPAGHKLDKLIDELAGATHPPGAALRTLADGWIEVNGSYAPSVHADVSATLQRLNNQGAVVETRYWVAGAPLGDWEAVGGAAPNPPIKNPPKRPEVKKPVKAAKPSPEALPNGKPASQTDAQIAKENATARHVALVVSTGALAVASGVVYAIAADAKHKALDPEVPDPSALAYRDQANGLTWGWIGGAVVSGGLAATLVITW